MPCRGPALGAGHEDDVEDDARFEWVSPDERVRRPFARGRRDALALACEWDLCVSGEGLAHLHHVGADAAYVPLTQARATPLHTLAPAAWSPRLRHKLRPAPGSLRVAGRVCISAALRMRGVVRERQWHGMRVEGLVAR